MQLGIPAPVRPEEIIRKQSLGGAIELCAEAAGFVLDKQLADECKLIAERSGWLDVVVIELKKGKPPGGAL